MSTTKEQLFTDFIIQNMSSGDVLYFKKPNVNSFSIVQELKYEESAVVGRMDPITNYINTTKKYTFDILQQFNEKDNRNLFLIKSKGTDSSEIDNVFKNAKSLANNDNSVDFEMGTSDAGEANLYKFLYPSYKQIDPSSDSYYVSSGLFFRFKLAKADDHGKVWQKAYCTITNMTWQFESSQLTSVVDNLKPKNLKINLQGSIIHENVSRISSRIIKK